MRRTYLNVSEAEAASRESDPHACIRRFPMLAGTLVWWHLILPHHRRLAASAAHCLKWLRLQPALTAGVTWATHVMQARLGYNARWEVPGVATLGEADTRDSTVHQIYLSNTRLWLCFQTHVVKHNWPNSPATAAETYTRTDRPTKHLSLDVSVCQESR